MPPRVSLQIIAATNVLNTRIFPASQANPSLPARKNSVSLQSTLRQKLLRCPWLKEAQMKTGLALAFSIILAMGISKLDAGDASDQKTSSGCGFLHNCAAVDESDQRLVVSQTRACQSCNDELKRQTATCNTFYPPSSQVVAHRDCLAKARSTYDSCRAANC